MLKQGVEEDKFCSSESLSDFVAALKRIQEALRQIAINSLDRLDR